ncbi:MAG: cyclic nucleotide-binding domain-containing protein [Proteobacteria bacterium]|nr:cyclic nucleotide-binding domain-containing protein [Pseudomonadota bacterium]
MDATELLRSIPMFEGLVEEDLVALAKTLVARQYRAGQAIFALGDEGESMFIIAEGDVNIHLPGEDSRRISLKDLSRGEFFGELAMFDDKPRSASAQATSPTVLLELQRSTLEDYLDHRPRAAMAILRTMSERLRETNSLLSARAAKNVDAEFDEQLTWSQRLADAVAELNGSWTYIILLFVLCIVWFIFNDESVWTWFFHHTSWAWNWMDQHHWLDKKSWEKPAPDAYPYQFFNLVLAIMAVLQGPLIVMSQNRQGLKDRARGDTDFKVNLKNEVNIETLLRELGEFRAEMDHRLDHMQHRPPTP